MTTFYRFHSLLLIGGFAATLPLSAASAAPDAARTPQNPAAVRKFEQAVDRIENMQLPLNKVFLYRQAAVALASTDKPRAISLLKRALADIDAAEIALKAKQAPDDRQLQQLEFQRMPVYMLMERIDPVEALNAVAPPQTADRDTAFFSIFFRRLAEKDVDAVLDAAQRKLSYGASPAVVAAYGVLKSREPGPARTLATALIMKLAKTDPSADPLAVQAAFSLLRLLRTDRGALAPAIVVDSTLLSPESIHDLFAFLADAFLASDDPETLILGSRPAMYVDAIQAYAPEKADAVKALPFAQPNAKSLIFAQEKPVYDANHPDPATLTPEQAQQRASMKALVETQMRDANANIQLLEDKIKQPSLPQKDRDDAVFAIVDQANRAIAQARAGAATLNREAFQNGEVEFYNLGLVTGVIDRVSADLQNYSVANPKIAEAAAETLDGSEIETEVGLQIAIKEMTGNSAYLVIQPPKPKTSPAPLRPAPVSQAPPAAHAAAPAPTLP